MQKRKAKLGNKTSSNLEYNNTQTDHRQSTKHISDGINRLN